MGWVRTDDNSSNHPKFFRAGPAAFGFWVAGLGYCNRNRTDGFIPARDLPLVFVGVTPARALKIAETLVEVGSWKTVDDGWQVHDYLRYQPSAAQITADTDAAARRYTTWKQRRCNAVATEAIPQPNPTQPKEASPRRPPKGGNDPAGFQAFWLRYPSKVGRDAALRAWGKKACERLTQDILAGLERNMGHITREGGEYIPNPSTWLNQGRWKDEPPVAAPADGSNMAAARAFIEGRLT